MEALALVREVSKFSTDDNIEPFNESLVRACLQTTNQLYAEATAMSKRQEIQETFTNEVLKEDFQLLLMQNELLRSKRCLLTYQKYRLDALKKLTIGLPAFPANVRSCMSDAENRFQLDYASSLNMIAVAYNNVVNIHGPLKPPKDLYITVRVLKDCGVVQTEYGTLLLDKHSFHFVRKTDVEHLITQGYLAHIK